MGDGHLPHWAGRGVQLSGDSEQRASMSHSVPIVYLLENKYSTILATGKNSTQKYAC